MRVVFDHQCFLEQSHGGITRYFLELIAGLDRRPEIDVRGWGGLHRSRAAVPFSGYRVPTWMVRTRGIRRIVYECNKRVFERWSRSFAADIYHPTYYDDLTGPNGSKRVITVHDCIHERYTLPGMGPSEIVQRKRRQLELADHIVCVSQSAKNDICTYYDVPPSRVTIVRHGVRKPILDSTGPAPERPFVLFVGERSGYKNFAVLLKAFQIEKALRDEFEIVCAGGLPLTANETFKRIAVRQLSPNEPTLARLYSHAVALVYPSRYEGFGLPILEAMVNGCPVVTTLGGAIPEVAGDAAEYFDPDSAEDLVRALTAVAPQSSRRALLIAKGYQRASSFTWNRCVEETVAVYRKVASATCWYEA